MDGNPLFDSGSMIVDLDVRCIESFPDLAFGHATCFDNGSTVKNFLLDQIENCWRGGLSDAGLV